ncbi:MAG: UDP-N-acetylmuramoyl-tripeptide--D-alanyl-D-alanine ligase [Armatimonadetes bacterium]|nr:UDP-N-acetylmuramoyl-tripeptide--D-alanyl-D-alanine ligase [Armatimonadota bacterium]
MSLQELAELSGGVVAGGSSAQAVFGLVTDSRTVGPGELFIALRGPNADGHSYVQAALDRGAAGVMVSRAWYEQQGSVPGTCLAVEDPLEALAQMAGAYRRRFDIPVVGVTGSMGKTSTREMLGSVLRSARHPLISQANFNTEIGLPLTLMDLNEGHDVAVLEMAMRGRGQIAQLCEIARPTAALITNIGLTHVELLGSQHSIAEAKAELLDSLPGSGWSVLNADDGYFEFLKKRAPGPVISFGLSEKADFRGVEVSLREDGCARFVLQARGESVPVELNVPGDFHVLNSLAAVAAAGRFGVSLRQAVQALQNYRGFEKRTSVRDSRGGWKVFDDTYNASPPAMTGALRALAAMAAKGRKIAVLGDMRELGDHTDSAHRSIGALVSELKPDILVTVGDSAALIADVAQELGYDQPVMRHSTSEQASDLVASVVRPGDIVLVKGSRALEMEKVVERLQ